jgi:hypothetical protein
MRSYGEVTIRAIHLFTIGLVGSPKEAWSRAAGEIFGAGTSSARKGCPQNAFLGLCEEGLVKGIPGGQYTRSLKNKQYALDAIAVLRRNPELATDPDALWNSVMGNERKTHNCQMDVVVALWERGLVV